MPASRVSNGLLKSGGGFTIIELMVSISILGLLVAMLATIFGHVSRAWTQGEGTIERRRGARALTDFIAAELQGAMLPAEGGAVKPGTNNLQFIINPPVSQVPEPLRNADSIFWQAPLATEASFGEIAEIGYFVRWIAPDAAAAARGITASRPVLCRFFVNPSAVVDGKTVTNDDFLIYDGTTPSAWLTPALLQKLAPASAPTYTGLFAENVLGFWVRSYGLGFDEKDKTKSKPQELPRHFHSLPASAADTAAGYVFNRPYTNSIGATVYREERCHLPEKVQISIVQIDSHHVPRLDRIWESIRALTRETAVRDAAQFMERLNEVAQSSPAHAALLPGCRIYSTEIQLINAR